MIFSSSEFFFIFELLLVFVNMLGEVQAVGRVQKFSLHAILDNHPTIACESVV